jgi:uncharacterized protein YggE
VKKLAALIIVFYSFIIPASQAQEKADDNMHKLSVSGTAEIKVPADQASFSFSVVGFGETLRQAVGNANKKISDISQKLFHIGLKEKDLNTSSFFSGENKGGKAFLSSSKDFKAYMNVIVTLDKLDLLSEAILTLSECEVEELSNINFQIKDYAQLKQKARAQALDNAMNKAKLMADQAGIKLKKIVYLSENTPVPYYPKGGAVFNTVSYLQSNADYSTSEAGHFYEKAIPVVEEVSIVYEVE